MIWGGGLKKKKKKKNISAPFSSFYSKGEKNLTEVSHTGNPTPTPPQASCFHLFPFPF